MIDQALTACSAIGEVHLLAFVKSDEALRDPPAEARLASVTPVPDPSISGIAWNFVRRPRQPFQSHLVDHETAARLLSEMIERLEPACVIFDMLRSISLARAMRRRFPQLPLVLDMDDVLSLRYEQMLAAKNYNIVSTFRDRVPAALRGLVEALPRQVLQSEAGRMRRVESSLDETFDAAMLVSNVEAKLIAERLSHRIQVSPVPPAIALSAGEPSASETIRFLFLGNAQQYANAEALLALDRIAAALKDSRPNGADYLFTSVGAPNPRLSLQHVQVQGFIERPEDFFGPGTVLVVPVETGTGIRVKVLDAMASGSCVVATATAVSGIAVQAGTHYFECNTQADFVSVLSAMVEGRISPSHRMEIAAHAQRLIAEQHDPDLVRRRFVDVVQAGVTRRLRLSGASHFERSSLALANK